MSRAPITPTSAGAEREGGRRIDASVIALAVLVVLAWVSQLSAPLSTSPPDLDSSWRQVLGYALTHGWRFGVDLVFTYGPLGYFISAPYDPALYWIKVLAWELAFKLLLVAYLAVATRDVRGPIARAFYVLGLLFLLRGNDGFFFVSIVAIALSMLGERSRPRDALGLALLAVISLAKFTYFVLVAIALSLVVLRRAWSRSPRDAVRVIALYLVLFALVWTLAGQSLVDLPRYLQTASWIAKGYNASMGSPTPALASGMAGAMACLAIVVAVLHVAQASGAKTACFAAALLGCGELVALKAGLVRYGGPAISFFGFAAVAPYLLVRRTGPPRRIWSGAQTAAAIACTVLGACGYSLALKIDGNVPAWFVDTWIAHARRTVVRLVGSSTDRARLASGRAALEAAFDLPRMRAHIGRESVDVFGYSQAIALLNRFEYRPRPVFQSYSAYTPELIELNARFLESALAPRFVIFRLEWMDGKFPASEDGLSLQVMLRDYRPITCERGFLLLERDRAGASPHVEDERALVFEKQVALGESVDVASVSDASPLQSCLVVSMDIHLALAGALRSAARKAPPLEMRCELDDGRVWNARIAPGMMRTGVLASPFFGSQDDCLRWYSGERIPGVARFSVSEARGAEGAYAQPFTVRVYRDDALAKHVDAQSAAELLNPR